MHTISNGIKKSRYYDKINNCKTKEGSIVCEIIGMLIVTKDYNKFKEIFKHFCILLKNEYKNEDVLKALAYIYKAKEKKLGNKKNRKI